MGNGRCMNVGIGSLILISGIHLDVSENCAAYKKCPEKMIAALKVKFYHAWRGKSASDW